MQLKLLDTLQQAELEAKIKYPVNCYRKLFGNFFMQSLVQKCVDVTIDKYFKISILECLEMKLNAQIRYEHKMTPIDNQVKDYMYTHVNVWFMCLVPLTGKYNLSDDQILALSDWFFSSLELCITNKIFYFDPPVKNIKGTGELQIHPCKMYLCTYCTQNVAYRLG